MDVREDTERLKEALFYRCAGCCEKCGKSLSGLRWRVQHLNNDSKDYNLTNLVVLCQDCYDTVKRPESPWKIFQKKFETDKKREEYILLNGMLFLAFVLPAVFAVLVGFQTDFFYGLMIVFAHEAGHGIVCISGERFLCALAGFSSEMLVTAMPAFICFKKREICLAGFVLMMCAGMSLQHNGIYMQSAQNPHGTSFAGALAGSQNDITAQSHDWSIVFTALGLLDSSIGIGKLVEAAGHAITVIFFTSSILSVLPTLYGWIPRKLTTIIALCSLASAIYFLLSSAGETEIMTTLALSTPLVYTALRKAF